MAEDVYSPMGDAIPKMPSASGVTKIDVESPMAADPVSIETGDMIEIDYTIDKGE